MTFFPSDQAIVSVVLAGFALSATPGPSMLYVLSRTVGQSRAAGLASAVGLCLGGIILAIATALGLATVFATFDWIVVVLRYLGSAYLVWLGIGIIRDARSRSEAALVAAKVPDKPLPAIVWQGVLVELMNPKTVLFFALFLPPFVALGQGTVTGVDLTLQLLLLGILVPLTAVPSDIVVALLGARLSRQLNESQSARLVLAWIGGIMLIGIAVSLHWEALFG